MAHFSRDEDPDVQERHITIEANPPVASNCGYEKATTSGFVSIHIPFTSCNTQRKVNSTHIMYTNVIRHEVPPSDAIITRTTVFYIDVMCAMPRNDDPGNNLQPGIP